MPSKHICPECDTAFRITGPIPKKIECPECGERFRPEVEEESEAPRRKDTPKNPKREVNDDRDIQHRKESTSSKTGDESDFDFSDAERSNKRPSPHSRRDDGRPRSSRRSQSTQKKSFPWWIAISAGVGLAAVALIVVLARGGKDKKTAAAKDQPESQAPTVQPQQDSQKPSKNDPPAKQPEKKPNQQTDQVPNKQPDPEPKLSPALRSTKPLDDEAIRQLGLSKIEIPPLPPPEKRPILVLDAKGHSSFIKEILFTPDSKRFITVAGDKTIRIWDVETGETIKTIYMPNGQGSDGAMYAAALSPDGKKLYAGGAPFGRRVLIYRISMESGEVEKTYEGHRAGLSSIAVSPDGKWIASGAYDDTALIYNEADGGIAAQLKHPNVVAQVAFHPSDGRLATGCHDGIVRLWSAKAGKFTAQELRGHTLGVNCIDWNKSGRSLASGSVDGTIRIWSDAGALIQTIARDTIQEGGRSTQVVRLHFTRDGEEIVYCGVTLRGQVGVANVKTGKRRLDFPKHSNTVQACAVAPDGVLAATAGGDDNELYLWKIADGEMVAKIQSGAKTVWTLGWKRAGDGLVFGTENGGDLSQGFRLDTFETGKLPPPPYLRAQFDLETWSIKQTDFFHIAVKNNGRDDFVFKCPGDNERIYSASLLPGNYLIVGGSFALYGVDLKQRKIVKIYRGHSGLITAVAPCPTSDLFATSSTDQTIRIWKPTKDDAVVSFFLADREWIAWTPEGYYAASPNGERLMGWQINNGAEKTGTFYPAVQFRPSLYQPEIIRNLFRVRGDLRIAMALTIKERNRPIGSVVLNDVIPPEVKILSPGNAGGEAKLNAEMVEVKAAAQSSGKHPVQSLRLLVDGRPFDGDRGVKVIANPKLGAVEQVWKVAIPRGKHTLHVQAESAVSKGLSPPVEIDQRAGEFHLPNLVVLAVGVNEYPGRMKLHYAATDAVAIARVMQEKTAGVFGKVEVKVILDKNATKQNVLEGLNWMEAKMTANDVGIFFFSGHGGKDDEDNFYLIPVDIGRNLVDTGIPGEAVKKKLANMPGRLVAVFDACHSGAAAESFETGQVDDLVRDLQTDDVGVLVLCSSMGSEYSLESAETRAGYFTLGLVEGLRGKADFNRDGLIYVNEACMYATIRVKQLSHGDQNPTLGRSPNLKPFALTKP